jgi:hypothetical protein
MGVHEEKKSKARPKSVFLGLVRTLSVLIFMEPASHREIKLIQSTRRRTDVRCLGNFSLEDWASLKALTGCFENLYNEPDQQNRRRDTRWRIYRLPHNDLIPILMMCNCPEN